ncbi:MAG: hypothetical protein Q3M24_20895 [Candidatus Electrothrix aestuarii]|uniref:Uncharacterized protein n=1 Tax=Candidatus Electrothrix aestuarii TaxID=3062594 RepID=A0AAU8LUX9_9BACT
MYKHQKTDRNAEVVSSEQYYQPEQVEQPSVRRSSDQHQQQVGLVSWQGRMGQINQ